MDAGTLMYIIVFVVAIICLIIGTKAMLEAFWIYFGWVVFNLILGLFLLNPWGIFS